MVGAVVDATAGATSVTLRRLAFGIAFAAALATAGCGETQPDAVLDRAISADPETLDPQRARSVPAAKVLGDLFEGLTTLGPAGRPRAGAARDWSVSGDGLVWRFELDPRGRWSNGEPVVAGDFVRALRRLADPDTAAFYAHMLTPLGNADAVLAGEAPPETLGVAAPDERTVEIRLARPAPELIAMLAHPSASPVHGPSLAEHGEAFARPGRLVSNGAYMLAARSTGATIALTRNPHFRETGQVAIETVRYRPMEDETAEYHRYRAGELEITSRVPLQFLEAARRERARELRIAPYPGVYYLGFNLELPPFADEPLLRRALSLALDRERMVTAVTRRGERPAWGWVPPGVGGYRGARFDYAGSTAQARLAEARELYAAAGFGPEEPLRITLRYNTSEENRRIAVAVQQMWREALGVETELVNQEFRVLLAETRSGNVSGLFRASWIADYDAPAPFLEILTSGHSSNLPGYADPEYDALVAAALAAPDEAARARGLARAEAHLLAAHPVLPVYFYVSKHLVSPRVAGWQDNPLDYHYSRYLRLVGE